MRNSFQSRRISQGLDRGVAFEFLVDGEPVQAYPGETIAAALFAAGRRWSRITPRHKQRRGLYCGMGVCWECAMVVDGRPNVRTCITLAAPGMTVEPQWGLGAGGGK